MKKWISGLLSLAMFMTGIGAAVAVTSSKHKPLYGHCSGCRGKTTVLNSTSNGPPAKPGAFHMRA